MRSGGGVWGRSVAALPQSEIDHPDPVAELRRVYEVAVAHWHRVGQEYGAQGQRPGGRIEH